MNDLGRDTRSIEEILAAARARLDRVEPQTLQLDARVSVTARAAGLARSR